ncbi:MAG: hypothetical protein CVT84_17975, partial [Alphaproteobacteria bacterium HGW-Alphaproteobacteria-6]
GPFALLPHVHDRCGLVWCVASDQAEALMQLPEEDFLRRAHHRFGDSLGPWLRIGKRSAYPLRLVRARSDTAPRSIILGNAAHAIHPVGAQGFNLGLRDVAVVAELIAAQREQNSHFDPGSPALLAAYSRWRAPDHSGTIAYSDGLARLYANPTSLAALVRHAGLLAHALIWVGAAEYRPRLASLRAAARAVAEGRRHSLAGCLISPGRDRIRIAREYQAVRGLIAAPGEVWDRRWRLTGPAEAGDEVRALGPEGLLACPDWRATKLPQHSLIATPAVWRDGRLVAAPLAGSAAGWRAEPLRPDDNFHDMLITH